MIVEEILNAPPPETLARALCERPGFFFLDSARPPADRAFSFLGFDPFLTWRVLGNRVTVETQGATVEVNAEPLTHLRDLMARYRSAGNVAIPFTGGAVGFFGYEFGAGLEGVRRPSDNDGGIPDSQLGFYDGVIACDLVAGKTFAIANPVDSTGTDSILARLHEAVRRATRPGRPAPEPENRAPSGCEPVPDLKSEAYLRLVARAKEYIAAGDIYQVNLSQRFECQITEHPYSIYERLRRLSPAPFGAYLNTGDGQILSSSPELLLRLDRNGRAVTRPIKGTRPRGGTAAEDESLRAELLASEKDHAELLMIVDLERNDLGRVCEYGSIRVEERHRLEAHPTVFHLVATISGRLRRDCDVFDCVRSMFPGGSITGAPKIRAMQIIGELETGPRHVYTGSLGYLGFDGTCDLNIAIRTIQCRGNRAVYHVGGAIVSDSDPAGEYQETLDKGRAMRAALRGGHA
ncbi:aminodeoxychorismate synthase component I [Opitutus sp. GAS368]|uniref:aminodeoxychorismate synthase component I n=1 Tax=Opitutus sp. GAS368 TaxID=1882749 RepID=UPI000879C580|nr:aminodeoxychorismate synthase component I [Opitutus sp. GAS368]SDS43398.1 aminodeoxychorismate synthase, subunit I [Opitutus sp. GAS368]